jgi:ankyrin repeat protein
MKLLLECTPDGGHAAEQLGCSLRQAVLSQREEAAKLLLDWGANPNKSDVEGTSPLLHALFQVTDSKSTAIVRLLRDHGADPGSMASRQSDRSSWPADAPRVAQQSAAGVQYQCFDTVQLLLDHGIDINICNGKGETMVHIIAKERMHDSQKSYLVRFLSGAGAKVDTRTHSGETALHMTVGAPWSKYYDNRLHTVRALCECEPRSADQGSCAEASINAKTFDGLTAIHLAVNRSPQAAQVLKILCEFGADANDQDASGNTALHRIANDRSTGQRTEKLRVLKTAGANLDTRNFKAETPLHIAVRSDGLEYAMALIYGGANLHARNSNGVNALQIAITGGYSSIASTLKENGADLDMRD